MRVIFIGDIVGDRALRMAAAWTARLREDNEADFIIANGENAAEGSGLKVAQARLLFDSGTDCITLGNHSWGHWALSKYISQDNRIIRPGNVPQSWPGNFSLTLKKGEHQLCVVNLLGNVFMKAYASPFAFMEKFLAEHDPQLPLIADFHAEASAEKQALARACDGALAAVLGTHTHVQTADECILPGGTGYITDVGMTGPMDSVIGMDIKLSLRRFVDQLPSSYRCAGGRMILSAVFLDIDPQGTCRYIERIQFRETEAGMWQDEIPPHHFPRFG